MATDNGAAGPAHADKNMPAYAEKLTWLESLEAPPDQRGRRLATRAWGGLWPVTLAILIVLAAWQLIHISTVLESASTGGRREGRLISQVSRVKTNGSR